DEVPRGAAERAVADDFASALEPHVQHLADQLAVERALVEIVGDLAEQRGQPLPHGPRVLGGRLEHRRHAGRALRRDFAVQMLARLEVVEEGARRDVGARADVLDLGAADAVLLEEIDRRVDQRLAVAVAAELESIRGTRAGGGFDGQGHWPRSYLLPVALYPIFQSIAILRSSESSDHHRGGR